jgi:hypothetical protein
MIGKYFIFVFFLIPFFAVSSNAKMYNPVLFNLSLLYDFNPVKGNVKELNTTVYNNDKSIDYEVNLKFDPVGCVESFRYRKPKSESFIVLDKKYNELKGKDKFGDVSIKLNDKCYFMSKKDSTGVVLYKYDGDGYIKDVISEYTGKVISEHTYTSSGLLDNVKFFIDKQVISESLIKYTDPKKSLDYEITQKMYGETVAVVKTKCDYNDSGVAYDCKITNSLGTQDKPKIEYQQVITKATFY